VARNRSTGRGPYRIANDGAFVYQLMEPSLKGYLLVRFDGDSATMSTHLRLLLKETTTRLVAVSNLRSLLDESRVGMRKLQTLLLILGAAVLALALIGIFGLLSFNVTQRRKDVAIRMALGADRAEIFRTIAIMGLRPIPIGILAGLLLSFGSLKLAESTLSSRLGLGAADPVPYLAVVIFLLVSTVGTMIPPAYRAAVSNPASALRDE
jgi:ABC-type antimicrobial peptide transport system permease subunit